MKLFQIEEPDGGPADPNAAGAAIGVDAGDNCAAVAFSVGGNALILDERAEFEQALSVPAIAAPAAEWQGLFERARIRAERALARPVTHAVIVLAETLDANTAKQLREAVNRAGLDVLRFAVRSQLATDLPPALAAAILAEELAPRPELAAAPDPG